MSLLEIIKNAEIEILETNEKISILEKKGGLSKMFHYKKLVNKLEEFEDRQYDRIDEYLRIHEFEYQEVIKSNYALLETPNIHFSVYTTSRSLMGYRTKEIIGDIYPNGFSYCACCTTPV